MRRPAAIALALLWTPLGCGKEVPHGGVAKSGADALPRRTVSDGTDLIPADLDLVVRMDLSQVREHLGDDAARELIDRALEESGSEGTMRKALAFADVVHLGLRIADFESGDRVLVVTGSERLEPPDSLSWKKREGRESIERYDARTEPPRNGIARIFVVDKRQLVLVSPVETTSIQRVLDKGPDPQRGQPQARGLISLEYRASRLSPELEKRYASLASLIGGVERASAIMELRGGQLELEGRIRCKNPNAAQKVLRFLATIRDAGEQSERFAPLLGSLSLETAGSSVQLAWPLPREVVAGWIHGAPRETSPQDP